jgi:hypothetical protein
MRVSDLRQRLPLSDFVKHFGFRFKAAKPLKVPEVWRKGC